MTHTAEDITTAILQKFPNPEHDMRIAPTEMEQALRPFAPISFEVEQQIKRLLHHQNRYSLALRAGPWMEAEAVVSGTGSEVERRILFLLRDTCTCVLEHLPTAIAHATKEVDLRILSLVAKETDTESK
jgi:hypothetical protein